MFYMWKLQLKNDSLIGICIYVYIHKCIYILIYIYIYKYIYIYVYLLFFYVVTVIIKVLNANISNRVIDITKGGKGKKRN